MTPTARTLKLLRDEGWTAQVVEHYNTFSHQRKDLFGFIDVLGIHPEHGTLAIQATTTDNQAARLAKILAEPRARLWLLAGRGHHAIEVWGWAKYKLKRGGKAVRWRCTRREVTPDETKGCE